MKTLETESATTAPGSHALTGKRVWVAGHRGMLGSALVRRLAHEGCEILTVRRADMDLRRQADVEAWMDKHRPHAVIVAAATAGGILANATRPAEFMYDNTALVTNIVHAAYRSGVEKLCLLGSSCIYPRLSAQPMGEDALLTGALEPTNQWYALAKIAAIKLCQAYRRQYGCDFIAAILTNLYGPGDDFDPATSHVIPALMRKTSAAMAAGGPVEVWGTGQAIREFLFVDDAAEALIFLMRHYSEEAIINVGGGEALSIQQLAALLADVMGYRGTFRFDRSRPDGMPNERLDGHRLADMGWRPVTPLRRGVELTYRWYEEKVAPFLG